MAAFPVRGSAALAEVAAVPVWSMSPAEQREALRDWVLFENQLAAARLRLLAEADRSGATDTQAAGTAADWLAGETGQTRRAARADLRLAQAMDRYPRLAAGMEAGAVNTAQARVIVTALDRLPAHGTLCGHGRAEAGGRGAPGGTRGRA